MVAIDVAYRRHLNAGFHRAAVQVMPTAEIADADRPDDYPITRSGSRPGEDRRTDDRRHRQRRGGRGFEKRQRLGPVGLVTAVKPEE